MALDIATRGTAGLPPMPASIGWRTLSSWTGITFHHQDGNWWGWRQLHDWVTKGRPEAERLAYLGYSFGLDPDEYRWAQIRGWDRQPAGDHDNRRLQVVVGGRWRDLLPPDEVLEQLVEFTAEARRRTGGQPGPGWTEVPHADVWPDGNRWSTSCPAKLAAWVRVELPRLLDGTAGADRPPATRPAPAPAVEFPLPAGHYFGPASGPRQSVSGLYLRVFRGRTDREWLQSWTTQLTRRGWPIGVGRRYLTRHGPDGLYGPEYAQLAQAFQADQRLTVDGLIGVRTWDAAYRNPVT